MIRAKQELLQALGDAIAQVAPDAAVTPAFENPKQAAHGDFAITLAMQLARAHKRNPRELAAALVEALQAQPAVQRWVSALEIAGPGFINLRLSAAARQAIVAEVLAAGDEFGRRPATGQRVMVEFVSANPTGPLHVGHGRNAALGDCISSLLQSQGAEVLREFYYNDAGVQIHTLAVSTQCRLKGLKPGDAGWPEQAYNGEYIADIAAGFAARQTVKADDRSFTASGDPDDLDGIRQFAVAWLRHEQDLDLQAFGVHFDHYFLESSLYTDGRVEDTVQRLVAAGKTFEEGGALWLRSTEYGDDKDRVMRKSDGTYTYFVPDVAYHINKFQRGYTQVINVQGTDHHGTVARVRAGLQAVGLGIPAGFPDYTLYKMITVMRGGEEVKISKRAGSYVTLRDLIDWTSRDAVRFFLISRKADTEFVFDIDLALKANDENPVFYVQYAHARICSVQRQWIEEIGGWPDVRDKHQGRLRGTLNDLLSDIQSGSMATLPVLRQLAMLLANAALPEDVEQDFPSRLEKIEAQLKRNVIDGLSNRVGKLLFSTEDVKKQTTKLSDELRSSHPGFAEQISSCLEFDGMPRAVASKLFDTLGLSHLEDADCSLLVAPTEQALMRKLAAYPDMLATAAADHAPHDVAFYLRDLAAAFHSYYAAERFLVDDPALARARMALLAAVRQVLRNALQLLGVSAPEAMARDAAPTEVLQ